MEQPFPYALLTPKKNITLVNSSHTTIRTVYISMSTGRISPVLCSLTHNSLSLAGSTFRSNWSTSSTVWNKQNKNQNVNGTFQVDTIIALRCRTALGMPAWHLLTTKYCMYLRPGDNSQNGKPCKMKQKRGRPAVSGRDKLPTPGTIQSDSWT